MTPRVKVLQGDCLDVMRGMKGGSVDAVVTDPPAAISFMGKSWDSDRGGRVQWVAWMTEVMSECLRLLKPGGHAFVWALPRTSHWTAAAIDDAGFEVRDIVTHLFGSGFPKSLDVSKAIDKAAGAEREVIGEKVRLGDKRTYPFNATSQIYGKDNGDVETGGQRPPVTVPATPQAAQWEGWGTALKPASEHWILARKPLAVTVAANVLAHGTGALNIDGCRIAHDEPIKPMKAQARVDSIIAQSGRYEDTTELKPSGRWPANAHCRETDIEARCWRRCANAL